MTRRHSALVGVAIAAGLAGAGVLAEGGTSTKSGDVTGTVTVKSGKNVVSDLSQLVVFIDDDSLPADVPATNPEMHQRNMTFDPSFLVVQRGTTVSFPNEERKEHNVYSDTLGSDFDLGRYKAPKSASTTFGRTGPVDIGCRIHRRMGAKIYVVPNRYFDEHIPDGKFRIRGVPAGKYTLTAWMPGAAAVSTTITIKAGKTVVAPAIALVQSPEPASRRSKDDPRGRSSDY